ncbi:hypothetical protein KY290_026517 [Solanum tuberosum]|uniref:NB-ARC domain-containing protein n=1 Tax=Solanum tuberosum TaxID=4113 RepID=A0ABQ7UYR3_SOLTU|nr:hypothetical protein KY290_026517 [Solanum tuberosum]
MCATLRRIRPNAGSDNAFAYWKEVICKRLCATVLNTLPDAGSDDGFAYWKEKIRKAYEVEYVVDACINKNVPHWFLKHWLLDIIEDTMKTVIACTSSQLARTPRMNEEIVGFEDVIENLRNRLLNGTKEQDVISIHSMPGLGKTTLANRLYSDMSVVPQFDICAKRCVSQLYSSKDLLFYLIRDAIGEDSDQHRELHANELADKLRKALLSRRYLILVDDVWDNSAWDDLRGCFPDGNNSSRIILTARHHEVAKYASVHSDPLHLRRSLEDIAEGYLENHIERNLVMVTQRAISDGKVKACRLHDVLLDFCKERAAEENFLLCIKRDQTTKAVYSHKQHAHLAFTEMDNLVVIDFIPTELPYLRYFSALIDQNSIPSSISNLWSLETLILKRRSAWRNNMLLLPGTVWDMVKLRHLHIPNFSLENEEALLKGFRVGKTRGKKVGFVGEKGWGVAPASAPQKGMLNFPLGAERLAERPAGPSEGSILKSSKEYKVPSQVKSLKFQVKSRA